jgi:hypothetical protein
MTGSGDKVLQVDGDTYVIDEGANSDIAAIVMEIDQALMQGTVVKVPVRGADNNRRTLYLNGGQIGSVVLDTGGDEDKPGEISPH